MIESALIDVPLENRDRISSSKKLNTAVSVESPDLFRICGVPCIDRGIDKLKPPVAYEHWRKAVVSKEVDAAAVAGDDAVRHATMAPNFGRPSSVSADTPNFFKVRVRVSSVCTTSSVQPVNGVAGGSSSSPHASHAFAPHPRQMSLDYAGVPQFTFTYVRLH